MTRWLYIGSGRFVSGVPARDLTQDEVDDLLPDAWAVALANDLYQKYDPVRHERRTSPASPVKDAEAQEKDND